MVFPQPNEGNLLEMCLFISWKLAALHPCCSMAADPCAWQCCAGREWQQRWKDFLQQQDRKTQPEAGAVRTGLKTGCVTRPEGSTQCSYSEKHCHKVTFWQRHRDLQSCRRRWISITTSTDIRKASNMSVTVVPVRSSIQLRIQSFSFMDSSSNPLEWKHSTSMSSFRTKQQCNHTAAAIELTTLLFQINRIVSGKKNIAAGAKRGG